MSRVLQADASAGNAYAAVVPVWTSHFWVEFDLMVPATALAAIAAAGPPNYFTADVVSLGDGMFLTSTDGVTWHYWPDLKPAATTTAFVADVSHTIRLEAEYLGASSWRSTWTLDGSALTTYTFAAASGFFTGNDLRVGAIGANSVAGEVYYIDNVKVGTTAGGTDLFQDNFESGTFAAWALTTGAVSIVGDPATAVHGVLLAFDDPVLAADPTWTNLGGLAGVSVQQVQVQRGRPTERDKTQVGTATITGVCTSGILDPTYGAGTLFGKLDPMKQVQIELQNPVTSLWSSIFRGFVSDWNYELDVSEKTYTFEIQCEDALAIIADAEVIPDVAGNTVPAESTGDVYYDPTADNGDRILAAIADTATTFNPYGADWPAGLLSTFTGNTQVKGTVYSPRSALLGVIDDAADADLPWGSNRYVSKTGIITFHGRLTRFDPTNPTYGVTFWTVGDEAAYAGDATTALISGLKFTRGKTNLLNAALVTPRDIKDSEIAGQFSSDATSITAYGARSISFENLLTDGSSPGASWGPTTDLQETKLMADGLVANYKDPRTRISEVTFRPQGTSGNRATRSWALICGVELNDVFTTTTSHPGGGGFSAEDQFVESLAYAWDVEGGSRFTNVTVTAEVSPRANWNTNPFA